jgi:hypothetical protein
MRWSRTALGAWGALALSLGVVVGASPASGESSVEAFYQMNEPVGATVMTDSSGNGIDGVINPAGVRTGVRFDGETGYRWKRRNPTAPPASPERIIQVADNSHLDPGTGTFTVEIRYRTKEKFGNIIQKGQARTFGGQWKIQNPQGRPSCLFKGSIRRVATRVKAPINDNTWHTLTCVRTPTEVRAYVDGVFNNRQRGNTGAIDNKLPMTIGGKLFCNQIKVTCDYFSGEIDYVRITRG